MKKNIITAAMILSLSTGPAMAVTADGICSVIGYKEPKSNTYDGPTLCGEIMLSYLTVRGPLQLTNTKINGKTIVSGPIKAVGAALEDVDFENNHSAETFTLQSSTIINGDVTFKGKEGVVYVDNTSKINGKVINGKVVYQSVNSK